MQPVPGARLAHYEISALLGKGGMGEVWRATDTKLGRDVAIKVLPEEFTRDGERLARFEREARLLASLDHSNIASIYGIEEVDGLRFLVMQLAEGEDLAERLKKGSIPVDEAIAIARQIAEALEAAHEKGIIHRDLKPANVKLGDDGRVRVLDFGLAKALDAEEGDSDITNSPTMVRAATHAGVILGTAAYMSPEQARGKKVDRRADIWSFGVVLWEMLTGERMFLGETVSDTLAAVLTREVDLARLPAATPDNIRALIGRCLTRDARERLQAIGDARIELAHPQSADPHRGVALPTPRTSPAAKWMPWLVALVALALSAWLAVRGRPAPNSAASSYELAILPPEKQELVVGSNRGWGIISPDGRRVAFLATSDAGTGLWVRSLERDDARFVPGTEGAFYPFWSPDSRWLAFFADGKLRKVEPGGGLPEVICAASQGRGGSWGSDGWIYLSPMGGGEVHRVRAEGGAPAKLTTIDPARGETAHYWPQAIGADRFLYFIRSSKAEFEGIYLGTVDATGKGAKSTRLVASSSSGVWVPEQSGGAGHLLWVQDGRLLARPMDPATGNLSGNASDLGISVGVVEAQRGAMMSVSTDGTIVFLPPSEVSSQLGSWSRSGAGPVALELPPGVPFEPRVSPDGRSLGFILVNGGDSDIWNYDFARGSATPVTSGPSYDEAFAWSPDSRELLHAGDAPPLITIKRTKVRGVESKVVFTDRDATSRRMIAVGWMPDGIVVLANGFSGESVSTLAAKVDDLKQQTPLIEGGLARGVSPDGKWVLYETGSPDRAELMVASLRRDSGSVTLGPDRQRVAVQGVNRTLFTRGGRELLLKAADGFLYSVSVGENADGLTLGAPVKLFRAPTTDETFAASPDGETLYFSFEPGAETRTFRVLSNWKARLR